MLVTVCLVLLIVGCAGIAVGFWWECILGHRTPDWAMHGGLILAGVGALGLIALAFASASQ